MNVLIIGATGNIGRHTLHFTLEKGHTTNAFGRSIEKIEEDSPHLEIFKGSVLDRNDVLDAMKGQDVVILTFGAPLKFDTIVKKPNLTRDGTEIVINAMQREKVPRLICMTAIGAGNSRGHGRFVFRNFIEPILLRNIMKDRTEQEFVVKNSGLDEWVIVRPTELSNDKSKKVRIIQDIENEKEPTTISRKDVGRILVDLITDKTYDQQTILITNDE